MSKVKDVKIEKNLSYIDGNGEKWIFKKPVTIDLTYKRKLEDQIFDALTLISVYGTSKKGKKLT